jgi:tRNA pseudouridine38-40 synthase
MLDIGTGKISLEELKKITASRDRKKAGRAVPAHGLFLTEVKYPSDIFINQGP